MYEAKLTEAVARDKAPPHTGLPLYTYGVAEVPGVVAEDLSRRSRSAREFGGVVKATARALGIKPTMGAIRAYLNGAAPLACMACGDRHEAAQGARDPGDALNQQVPGARGGAAVSAPEQALTASAERKPWDEPKPWEPTFSPWRHGGWYVQQRPVSFRRRGVRE